MRIKLSAKEKEQLSTFKVSRRGGSGVWGGGGPFGRPWGGGWAKWGNRQRGTTGGHKGTQPPSPPPPAPPPPPPLRGTAETRNPNPGSSPVQTDEAHVIIKKSRYTTMTDMQQSSLFQYDEATSNGKHDNGASKSTRRAKEPLTSKQ